MKTEGQELEFHGGYLNGFLMCAIDIVLYAATIGALVKGRHYFVRVDAFNESGITEGICLPL